MKNSGPGASWELSFGSDRIVAIGDIHGDLNAFVKILLGMSILGEDGSWMGGSSGVVLIGDLNDRGSDSAAVMSLAMELEAAAQSHGGKVATLLGNHELLAAKGDYSYVRATEVLDYEYFRFGEKVGLEAIYRGNSPWARWIRKRPTMVKAGETLFVHAGLGAWALDTEPTWINSVLKEWVAHFQGVAEEPDERTRWLTSEGGDGPLWTRRFDVGEVPCDPQVSKAIVSQALVKHGVRRIVVGHCPTKSLCYDIATLHPLYGESAIVLDTGISKYYGGRLSALEILEGTPIAHYFERGDAELPLTRFFRAKCAELVANLNGAKAD